MVGRGLASNPSLATVRIRIERASALVDAADAARYPRVDAGQDVTRERYTANGAYPPPFAGATKNSGSLYLTGSWEIDAFGRERALLAAAIGSKRAAEAEFQAARVLLATNIVPRADPRWISTASFAVFAGVLLMRAQYTPQVDEWSIIVSTFIQGAALATLFTPLLAVILSGLEPDQIASASGLSNFVRITAGAFGTSITTTLWDDRATLHHAHLTEFLTGASQDTAAAYTALGTLGLSPHQVSAQVNRLIDVQAFTRAADDIFLGSAVLFVALIAVVLLTRPGRTSGAQSVTAAE